MHQSAIHNSSVPPSNLPEKMSSTVLLSLFFFFLLALQEMFEPAVVFTVLLGNERKLEFIFFRDRQGKEESPNFFDPEQENEA